MKICNSTKPIMYGNNPTIIKYFYRFRLEFCLTEGTSMLPILNCTKVRLHNSKNCVKIFIHANFIEPESLHIAW